MYMHICMCVSGVQFHLSLLKRSEAIPADYGSRSAFLGLPHVRHPGLQALSRGTVDQLQPGLDGWTPAGKEAVRVQVQWECLVRTNPSGTSQHSRPIWLKWHILFLKRCVKNV